MTRQYIHVDSSYRNRLLYPNPSDFVTPYVAPSGTNLQTYMNPVSKYLPLYNLVFPLCSLNRSIDFFDTGSIVPNSSVQLTITGGNSLQIFFDPVDLETFLGDFENDATNHDGLIGLYFVYGSALPYQSARIIDFDESAFSVTLDSPVTLDLSLLSYGYIYNTSTASKILVNGSLKTMLVYDVSDLYIYNSTLSETRHVTIFNNGLLELDEAFSSSWTVNDFYLLFRNRSPVVHKFLKFSVPDSYYVSCVKSMRLIKSDQSKLTYNQEYELIDAITMASTGVKIRWVRSTNNMPFKITSNGLNVFTGTLLVTADLSLTFEVSSCYQAFKVSQKLSMSYKNTFFTPLLFTPLYDRSERYVNNEISFNVFPIAFDNYDTPPTNYQQLQNLTGSAIIYDLYYDTTENATIIYVNPFDGDLLERFQDTTSYPGWWDDCVFALNSAEQYSPLNYSGSTVSSDESVCYEIELVNLIFPNTYLNGLKVLTSFYPYFLVEFSNLSYSFQNTNSLLTNNPNAQRALFPIPISDVSSPLISQFLNLNCPCSQIVKFKPNDSFHFRIFYPNGETLATFSKDTLPPYVPDPTVQLSAVFSIKRL